jgi:hypothetical protein
MLVTPAAPVVVAIRGGVTHVAALQVAAAGIVNVLPLED